VRGCDSKFKATLNLSSDLNADLADQPRSKPQLTDLFFLARKHSFIIHQIRHSIYCCDWTALGQIYVHANAERRYRTRLERGVLGSSTVDQHCRAGNNAVYMAINDRVGLLPCVSKIIL
jgi:hypothetical protein